MARRLIWERDRSCGMREDPGIFDTGNGAIRTYETVAGSRLGIKRVTTRSYCGRDYDNDRYYTVPGDERTYRTYQAALRASRRTRASRVW